MLATSTSTWNPWDLSRWDAQDLARDADTLPMISIGILTYNRKDELRRTLDVLHRAVIYPKYEIIVIDNGSSDGTCQMVKSEFPLVRLHEVGENLGVASRNLQTTL